MARTARRSQRRGRHHRRRDRLGRPSQGGRRLRIVGRDDYITNQIEVRRLLQDVRHEWLAARGECLALSLATWTSEGGDEIVHYATFEIDAAGRLCRNDQYDTLTAAYDAFEARYVEIEGPDLSPGARPDAGHG